MDNWGEIRKEFETTKKTLQQIADQFDIKIGTLKSRKSREGWTRDATKKDATKGKKDATKKKKDAKGAKGKDKVRYPNGHPGNKNPVKSFTERNQAARKHGLFSRYMPAETLEIMGMIDEATPADLIWTQIQIQYAAIIRAQQIMHVEHKGEMIKELKKAKYEYIEMQGKENKGKFEKVATEEEYDFQFAWDRQATFLTAQTRALSELRASIKQFDEMAHVDDERRLKLENMRLTAEKTKAELKKLEDGDSEKPIEIFISRKEVRDNGETS